jgi:hypothetical protein
MLDAAAGEKRHDRADDENSAHAHGAETSMHASGFRAPGRDRDNPAVGTRNASVRISAQT